MDSNMNNVVHNRIMTLTFAVACAVLSDAHGTVKRFRYKDPHGLCLEQFNKDHCTCPS